MSGLLQDCYEDSWEPDLKQPVRETVEMLHAVITRLAAERNEARAALTLAREAIVDHDHEDHCNAKRAALAAISRVLG